MSFTRWPLRVASLEWRRLLTYRTDLIAQLLMPLIGHVGLSYFLWGAVFRARGTSHLGGYSFSGLMLYYLTVVMINRGAAFAWEGALSSDIYEGSLNRYLIYPLSIFSYKAVQQLARAVFILLQLFLALGVFRLFFPIPSEISLTPFSLALGVLTSLLATLLYFLFTALIDMVAFWADNTWSLQILFNFLVNMASGFLIPLSLFPAGAQRFLRYTPFPCLTSWPVRTFLGQISAAEWLEHLAVGLFWAALFSGVLHWVWGRGLRSYSGVGI